jgi:hypothetical protein
MKGITLFLLMSLTYITASAQSGAQTVTAAPKQMYVQEELNRALTPQGGGAVSGFDYRQEDTKGSPFLMEDWLPGKITLSDSLLVKEKMLLKFDALNNEFRIKLDSQERILLNRELLSVELETLDKNIVILQKIKVPNKENRHIFGVYLADGKVLKLYKDVSKTFKKANFQDKGIATVGDNFDSYVDKTTYYVRKKDNQPEKVSLKKNDLIEAAKLSKQNTEAALKFCKQKDLNGKLSELEAAKLIEYIDGLNF